MADNDRTPMFTTPQTEERRFPTTAVAIAAVAVVLLIVFFVAVGRHKGDPVAPNTLQPAARYAGSLPVSDLVMSESTSYSGAKDTYVDGHITNNGTATVTDVVVQVAFGNVVGNPKRVETTPLMLIRAREPYIDVEPVDAAPIAPGKSADFRLTFESIDPDWDQQLPEVRIVKVGTK